MLETVGEIGYKHQDMGIDKARDFGLEVGEDTGNIPCKKDPKIIM